MLIIYHHRINSCARADRQMEGHGEGGNQDGVEDKSPAAWSLSVTWSRGESAEKCPDHPGAWPDPNFCFSPTLFGKSSIFKVQRVLNKREDEPDPGDSFKPRGILLLNRVSAQKPLLVSLGRHVCAWVSECSLPRAETTAP